jgi:hypothetical protein
MSISAIRVFNFTILPLLISVLLMLWGEAGRRRERRLELFLAYLFGLGVAGNGISGAVGHLLWPAIVGEPIGSAAGSSYQLELGFENLALALLGIGATARRDGFREATVIAVTAFGLGAAIVHGLDLAAMGRWASAYTTQNVGNLVRPALLIWLLRSSRKAERSPASQAQMPAFAAWHRRLVHGAVWTTLAVSLGFGIGFALEAPFIGSWVGVLVGVGISSYLSRRR